MKKKAAAAKKASAPKTVVPKYPRHSLEKVLRIPKAILDQNAGKECSDETPRHSSVSSTTRDPTRSN